MKDLIKNIKYLWNLPETVKECESDIENLEKKLLAPEKTADDFWTPSVFSVYYSSAGLRKMTLEEKVESLAKYLKVHFEMKPEAEAEVVVKPQTKSQIKRKHRKYKRRK